jgi:hypothetical protein
MTICWPMMDEEESESREAAASATSTLAPSEAYSAGHRSGQAQQSGLGHAVRRLERCCHEAGDRSDADDASADPGTPSTEDEHALVGDHARLQGLRGTATSSETASI